MTLYLPLHPQSPSPPQPSFLVPPANAATQLSRVVHAIMKAKRIVVICGAGISVQAGIPDFRSSDGLFQTIKRDNPREAMSSGKELFDVSVFNSEQKTSLFCQMIAQLSDLSQAAEPTSFHHVLRALDDRGRLLRVYTQNIDAIEQKSGLSFGVPEFEGKRSKSKARPSPKGKAKAVDVEDVPVTEVIPAPAEPVASTSRLPSPPVETPRCIPLHGTLQSMHCQICNHSFPLPPYLPSLTSGQPPSCPECTALEATRQLVGKRPRGIGKLRPSVVLYNEAHKDGEGVGEVVQRDLMGTSKGRGRGGADLLLVVGTSLRVPGTKRMVREFAKAVKARGASSTSGGGKDDAAGGGLATPAPSPRRSPTEDEELAPPPKAIYLNLDFPVPTREWEGVFDAWIQGDAQEFAEVLRAEIVKEARAKEVAVERKRRRDEEAAVAEREHEMPDWARLQMDKEKSGKRKQEHSPGSGKRRRKAASTPTANPALPLSPPYTPPSPLVRRSHSPDSDDEDADTDPQEALERSKQLLRIPPSRTRPFYLVPEVYITTTPKSVWPQYLRPHELEMARRRSVTPPHPRFMDVDSDGGADMDVDVDVVGDEDVQEDVQRHRIYDARSLPLPPFNKHTKAGRKAARAAQEERKRTHQARSNGSSIHEYQHQRRPSQSQTCSLSQSRPRKTPPLPTHVYHNSHDHSHHHSHHNHSHHHLSSNTVRTIQLGIRDSA
ncbi:hypothetical protein GALMADRAFT_244772 [Galerina marginata CBS 339.88]|uniref:Deacetylase sirtuin-type domain-containing protein n=1 Tax=Galerina marginata (strain CBS 339.88) TaxID=685588 RepID=A0A067T782_GALM3|nr:hypothetical protein GALMADRAFT_244772 [Galerina marginata CBS 339.88]